MSDVLKEYPVEQVHRWYHRLADAVLARKVDGNDPLSGQFLKKYLENRSRTATYTFTPPVYFRSSAEVVQALRFHRRVFLTEERARLGGGLRWAGLIPRLKDGRWDGQSRISLHYESLVEYGGTPIDIARIQLRGTPAEQDLFTSLRGFQLRSDIAVTGAAQGSQVQVTFQSWQAVGIDTYDFNFDEYLTMPNPDYQSQDGDAIRPDLQSFRVYHTNAQRMEIANLAQPYGVRVGPWPVADPNVTGRALIDPNKRLP